MHDVENLVEESVICVCGDGQFSKEEKRSLLYSLYEFQEQFDTGWTLYRQKALLEQAGYLQRFPLSWHPSNQEARGENHRDGELEWLTKDSWTDPEDPGYFRCTAGGPVWADLKKRGLLTPEQAVPVNLLTGLELCFPLLGSAARQENARCAGEWLASCLWLFMETEFTGEFWESKTGAQWNLLAGILQDQQVFQWLDQIPNFQEEARDLAECGPEELKAVLQPYLAWLENRPLTVREILQKSVEDLGRNPARGMERVRRGLELEPDCPELLFYQSVFGIELARGKTPPDLHAVQEWADRLEALIPRLKILDVISSLHRLVAARRLCGQYDLARSAARRLNQQELPVFESEVERYLAEIDQEERESTSFRESRNG